MPETPHEGETHARTTEERLVELAQRRESGEVAKEDYNTNLLRWLIDYDQPLTAADLGNHALVMTRAEFEELGSFDVILPNGKRTTLEIDSFPGEILILYPKDLG